MQIYVAKLTKMVYNKFAEKQDISAAFAAFGEENERRKKNICG